MKAALIFAAVLFAGCANDVCRDVDGTCVALTVAGPGTVDGVEIVLSGAASGTKVGPRQADARALPVERLGVDPQPPVADPED